jgi:hypothetical protein
VKKFGERKSIAGENSEHFHGSRENFEDSSNSLFTAWEGEENALLEAENEN